jgi:hypothetical protein
MLVVSIFTDRIVPRILGLPDSLIRRDGFWLSDILISNPDERKNPWLALYKEEICTPAFCGCTNR